MVDLDGWCPNCGYSVEPGTRFCGGCGQQFAAEQGTPSGRSPAAHSAMAQSSTVTMQAPAPYPGYPSPAGSPLSAPVAPSLAAGPVAGPGAPPPPSGSPLPYPPPPAPGYAPAGPPPPGAYPAGPGQPGAGSPVSNTLENMLRPQGLFHTVQPTPADWQQPPQQPQAPPPPAPGGYPADGGYPQPGPYPQNGPYQQPPAPGAYLQPPQYPPTGSFPQPAPYPPAGGYSPAAQYPPTGGFPPAGPPQSWPGAALGSGGAVPPGPYPDGPYPDGHYPGGQYPGGQYPDGQFGAGAQHGHDGLPAGNGPAGPGLVSRLRARGPLIPAAVGTGLVVIVVAALALSTQNSPSAGTTGSGAGAGSTPAASASAGTALTQQQAASGMSGLLSQSGTDHSDVNAAVTSVTECKGLTADAKTFTKAAANRQALLAKLAALPGRSALPATMLSELTGAWQASATVDTDLARWAADGAGHCKKNNFKDPNYTATIPYDSKATNDKTAFVKQWNGLARKYGFQSYSPSQI